MIDLHDSNGKHIANFVNDELYDLRGRKIGLYLNSEGIFIDLKGRYLGEIIDEKRLLYRSNSPYKNVLFGSLEKQGGIGNYGNYGNIGTSSYYGFSDVKI